MISFWVKVKSIFSKNSYLGNFWTNLGHYLFQHLVTLVVREKERER